MVANEHDGEARLLLKRRRGAPDGRSAGSLSQFIREYLCQHGGVASREELLQAIQAKQNLRCGSRGHRGWPHCC